MILDFDILTRDSRNDRKIQWRRYIDFNPTQNSYPNNKNKGNRLILYLGIMISILPSIYTQGMSLCMEQKNLPNTLLSSFRRHSNLKGIKA